MAKLPSSAPTKDDDKTSQRLHMAALIIASILSSVGLILANKTVMKVYGFNYVLTLSASHFLTTWTFTRFAASRQWFERKQNIPIRDLWKMALGGTASIVCMNYNLQTNSVGFYQMTKLLCIPWIVIAQRYFHGLKPTIDVIFTLTIILLGVGLATVTDVEVTPIGLIFGLLAVATTAQVGCQCFRFS
jgi:solute carrier family 35 protein E3